MEQDTAAEARARLESAILEIESMGIPLANDEMRVQHFQALAISSGLLAIAEELRFLAHDTDSPLRVRS